MSVSHQHKQPSTQRIILFYLVEYEIFSRGIELVDNSVTSARRLTRMIDMCLVFCVLRKHSISELSYTQLHNYHQLMNLRRTLL